MAINSLDRRRSLSSRCFRLDIAFLGEAEAPCSVEASSDVDLELEGNRRDGVGIPAPSCDLALGGALFFLGLFVGRTWSPSSGVTVRLTPGPPEISGAEVVTSNIPDRRLLVLV